MNRAPYAGNPYRWLLLLLIPLIISPGAVSGEEAKVLSSGDRSISFEVTVPQLRIVQAEDGKVRLRLDGYGSFSPPGAPELPGKTFRIAIPALGDYRVSYAVLEEDVLPPLEIVTVPGQRLIEGEEGIPVTQTYQAADPWKDSGPAPVLFAARPHFMGRQRVLPVRVNPVIPGENGLRVVKRLAVTIQFGSGPVQPSFDSTPAPPLSQGWKRLYDKLLLNADDVSRLRKPLKQPERALMAPLQGGKRLKMRVPETGIYTLKADSLIAAGLSPGLSTGLIALKKLYYDENEPDLVRELDIPVLIREDNVTEDGIFNGEDKLIFYMLGIKDDMDAGDPNALFTDDNIIWLEEDVPGVQMQQAPPLPATPGLPLLEHNTVTKVRKDTYYHKFVFPGSFDYYFVTGLVGADAVVPFDLVAPASSGEFDFRIRVQGKDKNIPLHTLTFMLNGNVVGTGSIVAYDSVTYSFTGNPVTWLSDGPNELTVSSGIAYSFLINDFSIEYPALFRVRDDMLVFSHDFFLGTKTARIEGFTRDTGVLIDISDPLDPRYNVLTPDLFTDDGGSYALSLNASEETERRLIVLGDGNSRHIFSSQIEVDQPSNLRGEPGPYSTLVISHNRFLDELPGYISWRESQGYRILLADVEDIYDEFGGGQPSSDAIRRYIKYGHEHWGVDFVLLVGDGNEDHKRLAKVPPIDFIPPFTFCVRVTGLYKDEVIATDKWYTFLDEEPPIDAASTAGDDISPEPAESGTQHPALLQSGGYPDVFVGRFSVGEVWELRALLNKLYRFEEVQTDESWRRNIVLFADDAWSFSVVGAIYRYQPSETRFERSMDKVGRSIEASLEDGFNVQRVFLKRWTDGAHPNQSDEGHEVYSRARDSTQTYFVPYLIDKLNTGCLFYSFQGHANRTLLATEAGFASRKEYDHLRLLKAGSPPHIFIGIGCHISEFALASELSQAPFAGPGGDCISEQLLFKSGAGAVASYASSAFEYLGDNAAYCETLHRVLFQKPPTGPMYPRGDRTGAHWVLGEAITEAEIIQIDSTYYGYEQLFRYVLLGDPHLTVDPGPPMMVLEADWGEGWERIESDSLRARNGTNTGTFRLTVSDVVALDPAIGFEVNGDDWSDSLTVTANGDQSLDFSRSYQAVFDYTLSLDDESLLFKVYRPEKPDTQPPVGVMEYPVQISTRLFYNEYLEILPGSESPPTGTFRLIVDFPVFLDQTPVILLDGLRFDEARMRITDLQDSLHWESSFKKTFPAGRRVLTVRVGEFDRDFVFTVTGNELVLDTFNFPNPFSEGTNIVYTLNLPVDSGKIEIYNVSGILVRTIDLQRSKLDASSYQRPHTVFWDGRDLVGDPVANGTYIYVIQVDQGGSSFDIKGKSVKLE